MTKPSRPRSLLVSTARTATLVVVGVAETACNLQVYANPDIGPRRDAGLDAPSDARDDAAMDAPSAADVSDPGDASEPIDAEDAVDADDAGETADASDAP